jgi:hypothetical protein
MVSGIEHNNVKTTAINLSGQGTQYNKLTTPINKVETANSLKLT